MGLYVKYLLLLPYFNETCFSADFRNIHQYQISRKTVQWGRIVLCGLTDGQTDRQTDIVTMLIVAFRNCVKAS